MNLRKGPSMSTRDLFGDETPPRRILSVWELTAQIKELLEMSFPAVWVAGEISDLSRPRSGHVYLTLKDDRAQLRAAIWRNTAARLRFTPVDGLEVICRGYLDVYAPRGSYQLIIEQIEPKGIGALELALRQLRQKLAEEGLFDPQRKRPLPRFVEQVAVVTSPTGAAIRDFLQVLARRWRGANVLMVPTRVQGEGAAEEIAQAIETVNRLAMAVDCLVLTRGGGSLEELWAFNEEKVVRAIAASRIPVVSAVGHEIDVTLADLAADVRALTPSEAAELIAPDAAQLASALQQFARRLSAAVAGRAAALRARWESLSARPPFRRPYQRLHELAGQLDSWEDRAAHAVRSCWQATRQQLEALAGRLESLSPVQVFRRGYSLTQRLADGQVIRRAADLTPGQQIATRFAEGSAVSRVERIGEQPIENHSQQAKQP